MPRLRIDDWDRDHNHDDWKSHAPDQGRDVRFIKRERHDRRRAPSAAAPAAHQPNKHRRADGQESFKCGRCRAFIGPTVSGGRHRNHCPLCLHSRHVDDARPGDRASRCRSLMAPVGVFARPKGEQVVLHRCLGCGLERHNRVAADDNSLALLRLPPIPPRLGGRAVERMPEEEAIA